MTDQSRTPETDAKWHEISVELPFTLAASDPIGGLGEIVPADFCRSLELRLREAEGALALGWAHVRCPVCDADMMTARDTTVEQQAARIAELEKDAVRYRWLCINGRWRADWWKRFVTHEELSAAIDAALSPSAPVNPPVKEELDKRPD